MERFKKFGDGDHVPTPLLSCSPFGDEKEPPAQTATGTAVLRISLDLVLRDLADGNDDLNATTGVMKVMLRNATISVLSCMCLWKNGNGLYKCISQAVQAACLMNLCLTALTASVRYTEQVVRSPQEHFNCLDPSNPAGAATPSAEQLPGGEAAPCAPAAPARGISQGN